MEQTRNRAPMAVLDEPTPTGDPDGVALMASLRARIARGAATPPRQPVSDQYRPAMTALQALQTRRKALGASEAELAALQRLAGTLEALARGGQ
jgi:hypothetical protein